MLFSFLLGGSVLVVLGTVRVGMVHASLGAVRTLDFGRRGIDRHTQNGSGVFVLGSHIVVVHVIPLLVPLFLVRRIVVTVVGKEVVGVEVRGATASASTTHSSKEHVFKPASSKLTLPEASFTTAFT